MITRYEPGGSEETKRKTWLWILVGVVAIAALVFLALLAG